MAPKREYVYDPENLTQAKRLVCLQPDDPTGQASTSTRVGEGNNGITLPGEERTRISPIGIPKPSIDIASNRRSFMEYTFPTVGKCNVDEELIDHFITSLYN